MLKVVNLSLPLDFDTRLLKEETAKRLRVDECEIKKLVLDRRELVKSNMSFKVTVLAELDESVEKKLSLILRKKGVSPFTDREYTVTKAKSVSRPVIAGFGPAGIFAALVLSEAGLKPIVLERGDDTQTRMAAVDSFEKTSRLDPESNIQFGEGGAGAFSDGKLKIGYKDSKRRKILNEFVLAGASEDILYLDKPHIGSDVLHLVIVNLRKKLISLGAEIRFRSKLTEIVTKDNGIVGVKYVSEGKEYYTDTDTLILAIGHSARDTLEYLYSKGLEMEAKGFGVGVRIEHPQSLINKIEYGKESYAETLGSADYKMVEHLENGRSLYTFCMCPGGYVVPASSEEGGICTNGMSCYARDGENANTALLVSVTPDDFGSRHPLAGIEFQRSIERLAFKLSKGSYNALTVRLEDFMAHRETKETGDVKPTYKPGTSFFSPDSYLPDFVCSSLREGIEKMCKWKDGYYFPDALLTGPETRTTSPVRILRNERCETKIKGLYPAGEGAGYAGGIISSAADGMLVAESVIMNKLQDEQNERI